MARISFHLFRYQEQKGNYPESLEQIGLAKILDPFNEKPYQYKKQEDGFLLYSYGPDKDDDGGELPAMKERYNEGDILWLVDSTQ